MVDSDRGVAMVRTGVASGGRGPRVAVAALVVVCLLLAAVCGVAWWRYRQGAAEESARRAAMDAARTTALNLATIDHTTARRDVDRVLGGATGQFRDDFASSADSFVAVVEDTGVTTVGKDASAAVESWDDDHGTVLVQVVSTVTNRVEPQEKSRVWRLRMTMEDVDGGYRTAALEYLA